ncbi:MAG: 16S rRNA (cytidine(1402)-2'-O)-methyltransferase [Candidatus Sericytochromatia bacterium]
MSEFLSIGNLYLCGTPIGNLEDMTFRAIKILKEVDLIACEDTRQTIKLLNHFDIKTKMISYHQHNEIKCSEYLIKLLLESKNIALVSDAGMPIISDPGSILLKEAIKNNIKIIPIPAPSAFLMSLVVSGFDISNFSYYGFLPNKPKNKDLIFEKIKSNQNVSVIYESPHKLLKTLEELNEKLGNVNICICREITKKYEEFFRGNINDSIFHFSKDDIKGEFCIVIDKVLEKTIINEKTLEEEIFEMNKKDISKKDISKILSKKFNISSKEIYKMLVNET